MEKAISLERVSKRYGDKTAVDDVSFEIESGAIVALLGPNGAGKTTTISMMLGLAKPTHGQIHVFGQNPLLRQTRKHFGVMLQQVSLPSKLRVRELIELFRSYYAAPLPTSLLLELSGLQNQAKTEAVKLSGGQQRRLQYALAMAGNPRILFLDEPTTGMDVSSRRDFWDALRRFAKDDARTIILTTHHLAEAEAMADRVLFMRDGKVVADGTVEELKRQAGNHYVSFVAERSVTDEMVRQLPGAEDVQWSGRHVRISTPNPDDVLRTVIRMEWDVSHFEVSQGQLEDAFISITSGDEKTERSLAR